MYVFTSEVVLFFDADADVVDEMRFDPSFI